MTCPFNNELRWSFPIRAMKACLILMAVLSNAIPNLAQNKPYEKILVNQAGYNIGESKRFVAWGTKDHTPFLILRLPDSSIVYQGKIHKFEGDFSDFNPETSETEYTITVERGRSVAFRIGKHLHELLSSKLAYDFFVDVRGTKDASISNLEGIYGGGPSRDGGAYGLETVFEGLFYASNPALFDHWKHEMGQGKAPDLIALMLWHAEFAYQHVAYQGKVAERWGWLGYEGKEKMNYDYWNHLDQLAAVCAAYHSFLKPYLSKEKYQAYRKVCLDNWLAYDRHKVVRYWTYSTKWVDPGYQEFSEMGNAYGQSVFSNLFMYLCELHEKDGKAQEFLQYAQESIEDIIKKWDFNNPKHTWWIRNAEHITPQALAFFLLTAPEKAPMGTREKLHAWADYIRSKTNNPWKYRVHSKTEWAHPKTKELGGAPALGGSLFAASYILKQKDLRSLAWSQIDFVFGVNPIGTHLSNKSHERLAMKGYWEGVENGWPAAHTDGYGQLGLVRGTLDGTPLDKDFPRMEDSVLIKQDANLAEENSSYIPKDAIGKNSYATEGWAISNRGWMATLTFAALHNTDLKIWNAKGTEIKSALIGQELNIQLSAALNVHADKIDTAWVEARINHEKPFRIYLVETNINSGVFRVKYKPLRKSILNISYGYWGFRKSVELQIDSGKKEKKTLSIIHKI